MQLIYSRNTQIGRCVGHRRPLHWVKQRNMRLQTDTRHRCGPWLRLWCFQNPYKPPLQRPTLKSNQSQLQHYTEGKSNTAERLVHSLAGFSPDGYLQLKWEVRVWASTSGQQTPNLSRLSIQALLSLNLRTLPYRYGEQHSDVTIKVPSTCHRQQIPNAV